MYLHIGSIAFNEHQQTNVSDNEGIDISLNSFADEFLKERYLIVTRQGIAGKVHADTLGVGGIYSIHQLFKVEITG